MIDSAVRTAAVGRALELAEGLRSSEPLAVAPQQYAQAFLPLAPHILRGRSAELAPAASFIEGLEGGAARAYNRYALVWLASRLEPRVSRLRLPRSLRWLYTQNVDRIVRQSRELALDEFDFSRDSFLKDMALVCGHLWPVGTRFVQVSTSPRRKILVAGGLRQTAEVICRFGPTLSGMSPSLGAHLHDLAFGERSAAAREISHHRMADLLAANPHLHGLCTEGWLIDPQLAEISPHLDSLRRFTLDNGGWLFRVGVDDQATKWATMNSETRRQAWQEGRYQPTVYLRFWSTGRMVDWSRRTRPTEWGEVGLRSTVPAPVSCGRWQVIRDGSFSARGVSPELPEPNGASAHAR